MDITAKKEHKLRFLLLCLAVSLSIFSQMPTIHGSSGITIMYYSAWVAVFVTGLLAHLRLHVRPIFKKLIVGTLFFVGVIAVFTFLTGKSYISNETTTLLLSVFIFVCGYLNDDVVDSQRLKTLCVVFLVSVTLTAVNVYQTYFTSGNFNWEYDMKNSFSPLLLTGVIMLLLVKWESNSTFSKVIRVGISIVFVALILLIRSRATIICIPICIMLVMLDKRIKIQYKVLICAVCVGVAVYLLANEDVLELFIEQILLQGRSESSMSSLSSGRTDDIINYFPVFLDSMITGVGSMYLDCFYILSWYQYGIIVGSLVIYIALVPLRFVIKNWYSVPLFYKVLVVCFAVNGIFEGLTPIGPGVKCMMIWLMTGMFVADESIMHDFK